MILNTFVCFVGLKPFRSAQTIARLWDVGWGGGDGDPGRNGRRPGETILVWPGSTPSAFGLVLTPPANGGHSIPGGDARSATYPVDGVHEARITKGIGGWGIAIGEDKKRDQ